MPGEPQDERGAGADEAEVGEPDEVAAVERRRRPSTSERRAAPAATPLDAAAASRSRRAGRTAPGSASSAPRRSANETLAATAASTPTGSMSAPGRTTIEPDAERRRRRRSTSSRRAGRRRTTSHDRPATSTGCRPPAAAATPPGSRYTATIRSGKNSPKLHSASSAVRPHSAPRGRHRDVDRPATTSSTPAGHDPHRGDEQRAVRAGSSSVTVTYVVPHAIGASTVAPSAVELAPSLHGHHLNIKILDVNRSALPWRPWPPGSTTPSTGSLEQWAAVRPDLDSSPIAVIGRVSRLSRLVDRRLAENFARFGLENWMYDVLATLRRGGPPYELTAGDLVRRTMVTTGAITNRIDRLDRARARRAGRRRRRPPQGHRPPDRRGPGARRRGRGRPHGHRARDPRRALRPPARRPGPPPAHPPAHPRRRRGLVLTPARHARAAPL